MCVFEARFQFLIYFSMLGCRTKGMEIMCKFDQWKSSSSNISCCCYQYMIDKKTYQFIERSKQFFVFQKKKRIEQMKVYELLSKDQWRHLFEIRVAQKDTEKKNQERWDLMVLLWPFVLFNFFSLETKKKPSCMLKVMEDDSLKIKTHNTCGDVIVDAKDLWFLCLFYCQIWK